MVYIKIYNIHKCTPSNDPFMNQIYNNQLCKSGVQFQFNFCRHTFILFGIYFNVLLLTFIVIGNILIQYKNVTLALWIQIIFQSYSH